MTIGILAFQGDVIEHMCVCEHLGAHTQEVRSVQDLDACSALILPGGESTVISMFLTETGLRDAILSRVRGGMPAYGTCAGAILLSKKVIQPAGSKQVEPLGLIDVTIERNAYGRQAESFRGGIKVKVKVKAKDIHEEWTEWVEATFIRAPRIIETGPDVEVLAEYEGDPVLCRQGNVLVSTFHPELGTGESAVHRMLFEMAR